MLNKLERRFGKHAIPGLMKYVIILYAAGFIVYKINPFFYYEWLMLDIDKVLSGQVWRIITFIIQPMEDNIIFMALMLYVYYMIGNSLEHAWGTFRFNMFYITGVLFNILVVVLIYIVTYLIFGAGFSYPISLYYLNMSMFLAFAAMFPDLQFYLMFLIPVKAKYLGILYVILLLFDVYEGFKNNGALAGFCILASAVIAMANFIIYFLSTRKSRLAPGQIKRRMAFKREVRGTSKDTIIQFHGKSGITKHKCAVCGRTELDDENLEFRFCSKCEGNYEYCQEHLYTHEHKKSGDL